MSSLTRVANVSKPSGKRQAKKAPTVIIDVTAGKTASRRNRKGKKANRTNSVVRQYALSLENPFSHGPVNLGFGTLVPTQTFTVTYSTTLTVNGTDGSFAVITEPMVSGSTGLRSFLCLNNAGATTGTWITAASSQASLVNSTFQSARCLSLGVRVTPMLAGTAAPGYLCGGLYQSGSGEINLSITTPKNLSDLPSSRRAVGSCSMMSTWRPVDNTDYEFDPNLVASGPIASTTSGSYPYIAGQNYPVGTVLLVEAVGNFEGLTGNRASMYLNNQTSSGANQPSTSLDVLHRYVLNNSVPTVLTSVDGNYDGWESGAHITNLPHVMMGAGNGGVYAPTRRRVEDDRKDTPFEPATPAVQAPTNTPTVEVTPLGPVGPQDRNIFGWMSRDTVRRLIAEHVKEEKARAALDWAIVHSIPGIDTGDGKGQTLIADDDGNFRPRVPGPVHRDPDPHEDL